MPSISDILRFLQQLATQIAELVNPIAYIAARINLTATENHSGQINANVIELVAIATDGTVGNAALHTQLVNLAAAVTALGSPQQNDIPVILPPTYPIEWPGPLDTTATVWGQATGDGEPNPTMFDVMVALNRFHTSLSDFGVIPSNLTPYFAPDAWATQQYAYIDTAHYPVIDTSTILVTDTRQDWVTRFAGSTYTVHTDLYRTGDLAIQYAGEGIFYHFILDDVGFNALKASIFGQAATGAPVWPGLANVTLLTPVALASGITITESMDGVLVALTSVPANLGSFTFDTVQSFRNVGALAFFTDHGEEEFPQSLGFGNAIYTPRSMANAAGVVVRCALGVSGTITPYVLA